MLRQLRLLLGISVFWLALSMLTDGINTLLLPVQLAALVPKGMQATALGLLTFVGLVAGAIIQPYAGAASDRVRPTWGRRGFIALGVLGSLIALLVFTVLHSLPGVLLGYLGIQVSASLAQAGQQGLIPDLVSERRRGLASGLKGFMDMAGAMVGFALLGQLLGTGQLRIAVIAIAVVLVALYALAVLLTPEDRGGVQSAAAPGRLTILQALKVDVAAHAAFVRLLVARFLFLLGIYSTGRFLLYFVADRLALPADQAAEAAGTVLALLALVTIVASPLGGWLADRAGRLPLMVVGAALGAVSSVLLIFAHTRLELMLYGAFMSLGSAAFSGGSWALLADLVTHDEPARYFGLANFSTAGSSAVAGLLGPLVDVAQRAAPGSGYTLLFLVAALAFAASALPLRRSDLAGRHRARQGISAEATD